MLDVRVGKRYFLEFNPAVGYGENPLRLMSNHEGFELLVMSDMDDINIIDADIQMQVKKEKDNGYFEEIPTEEIAYVDEPDNGTTQYRGGGDPLKGLNVSSAKKEMEIGNYYALIIGIDNYSGSWSSLNNAVNDDKAVEDILKTRYKIDHFKTMYNESATRIIANFFLSINMSIGLIFLLLYFLLYESMRANHWVSLSVIILLIATIITAVFRMTNAMEAVRGSKEN